MILVALAEAAGLVVLTLAFASLVRSLIRQHARERDLLTNQLLHAVGKAWQPPPAKAAEPEPIEHAGWTASPEQLPVD